MVQRERSIAVQEGDIEVRDLLTGIKPALVGLKGPKIIAAIGGGMLFEVNVDSALPVEIELDPVGKVPGINLTLRKSFFRQYDVHIQIPYGIIRAYSSEAIFVESDGMTMVENRPDYVIYVMMPTPLGWIFILEEQRELLRIEKSGKELATAREVIKVMDELVARAIRLSIAGKTTHELKAVPSMIRISEEDFQEYLRRKLVRDDE